MGSDCLFLSIKPSQLYYSVQVYFTLCVEWVAAIEFLRVLVLIRPCSSWALLMIDFMSNIGAICVTIVGASTNERWRIIDVRDAKPRSTAAWIVTGWIQVTTTCVRKERRGKGNKGQWKEGNWLWLRHTIKGASVILRSHNLGSKKKFNKTVHQSIKLILMEELD